MTTPEGKVKANVRKVLRNYPDIYQYWPVPAGYGPSSLDCLICHYGVFIGIETKAPGKKPTARQDHTIRQIEQSGGTTFVIDGDPQQLAALAAFLDNLTHASRPCKSEA
jgi:hypothetical protein